MGTLKKGHPVPVSGILSGTFVRGPSSILDTYVDGCSDHVTEPCGSDSSRTVHTTERLPNLGLTTTVPVHDTTSAMCASEDIWYNESPD